MLFLILFINSTEDVRRTSEDSHPSDPTTSPHTVSREHSSSTDKFVTTTTVSDPSDDSSGQAEYDAGCQARWVKNNQKDAFLLFHEAAQKGHKQALLALATMATYGIGCKIDIALAIDCYSVLEDDPQAMNNAGALYEYCNPNNESRENSLRKALEYYQKSLNLNSEIARENHARVTNELSTIETSQESKI